MYNQITPYHISTDNIKSFALKTYQVFKSHGVKLSRCECLELVSKHLFNEPYEKAKHELREPVMLNLIRRNKLFNDPSCFKKPIENIGEAVDEIFYCLENMVEKNISITKQFLAYYSLVHFSSTTKMSFRQSFYGKKIHAYVRFNYKRNKDLVIDVGELDYKNESLLYGHDAGTPRPAPETKIPTEIIDFISAIFSVHSNVKITFRNVKEPIMQNLLRDNGAMVTDKNKFFSEDGFYSGDALNYSYWRL